MSQFSTVSPIPEIQQRYEEMRLSGECHAIAEICALQQSPGCVTDNTFMAGHCNENQFESNPAMGDRFRKMALKAGVNPKGKVFKHGLADYPGDPKAWVSGRGDVQKRCEEAGWGCQGAVKVKERPRAKATESVDVADSIVNEHTLMALIKDPGLREKPLAEVKDSVKNKLLPRKKKK